MISPVRLATAALLLAVVLPLAGCGSPGTPSPTPGGASDVIAALGERGVTVHEQVSDDDGCERTDLNDIAQRLHVSTAGDTTQREVYLFRWQGASDFDQSASDFFFCVGDFRSQHPGGVIEVVEHSPWRAYGADWSAELTTAVRQAVEAPT